MARGNRHIILTAAAMLSIAATAISWAGPKDDWDADAARRKAEYVFYEGLNAHGLEQYDDYALLIRRAYELDSTDLDIGAEWAVLAYASSQTDSAGLEKAYQALKRHFFHNTDDYLSGMVLANLANRSRHFDDAVKVWEVLDSAFPNMTQPSEELAQSYLISFVSGDTTSYRKALDIYDRMESGSGKSLSLSSQKIRAYALKSDTAAIVKEVEELLDFAPADSYVALFAGSNYQYIGKPDMALKYYKLACKLDSTNGSAYMAKAALYNQMGDSAEFDRVAFQALRSQSLEVEAKLEILRSYVAELYTDPKQEKRIRALFNELEQMHSGEAEMHNLYAAYLYEIKDYKGASEEMEYSVALEPTDEGAWQSLVQMLSMANDTLKSIDYSMKAMEKFPDNLYYPIVGADGYRQLGDPGKALALLDSVKISKVANPQAVSSFVAFRGDILAMTGDTLSALKAYDEAIDLNPNNNMALNNAAYFMAQNGIDLDKAEKYSSMSVRNEPENPTYLDTYAWVFFKKKDYTLAKQYIDMTINLYRSMVSDDVEDDGQLDVDVLADGEVVESVPSSEIYEHAGDIYFMNGEPDKAVEFWQKAYKLDPTSELLNRKVQHKTYFYK